MTTEDLKRLYIFTGKGGVGKSTLSLSFIKFLKESQHYQSKKIKYVYFQTSSLGQQVKQATDPLVKIATELGLSTLGLNLLNCAETYIGKKLKSQTLGKWVVKTPFFKSLINMIPGFNYLIYLGQILELLNEDEELILVLDSPSSGHALTMLEATHNFRDIFESGIVFEDTKKMIDLLFSPNFMKVNIITIPTLMAVNESQELDYNIQKIQQINTDIFCNNSFSAVSEIQDITLPSFLKTKIDNEQQVIETYPNLINKLIPYSSSVCSQALIKDLVPSMKNLV